MKSGFAKRRFTMKYTTLLGYSLSTILLLSCSQMRASEKRHAKVRKPKAPVTRDLSETVGLETDDLEKKKGAANHELADADADDSEIKKEVGETELDAELPDSDRTEIPYSRDFLALKKTKRMQFWVDYFTKQQRERFQRFINNGEEYRHHIEQIFMEHGLPKELYFVGLIESGYYLGARSHAAAVGPWQFIKGTAKRYNLKVTNEIDERQDLFKATHAAAQYFKDMNNVFSSWELSLAGYNAGEYGIIRKIMKYGTRDFYVLSRNKYIPSETINYVPKVLAAMHVVNNAEKYGFVIPKKKQHLFDRTELKAVPKNMNLASLARRLNVEPHLLKKLNPELRRNSTPRHFAGTYYLRVPQNKYTETEIAKVTPGPLEDAPSVTVIPQPTRPERRIDLTRRIAEIEKPRIHKIKRGETLLSVSRRYKIPAKHIAEWNGLASWRVKVRAGQRLALSEPETRPALIKATKSPIVYKVRAGDNLTDLARVFDVELNKLKRANKLKRGSIMVGQKIVLPGTQKGIYTVKKGDHLTKVARALDQNIEALVKLNALKRRAIYPGQKIIVNMD